MNRCKGCPWPEECESDGCQWQTRERTALGPSDATACSAYVVRGYALVPHEVEIWAEAESPRQAMQKAKKIFERGPNRGQWIVSNSEDIGAAYDFEPNEAKPPISRQNANEHPTGRCGH